MHPLFTLLGIALLFGFSAPAERAFSPIAAPVELTICTEFNPGEGYAGWQFTGMLSRGIDTLEGLGPNSIRLEDRLGPVTYGFAPPVYRGSWNVFAGGAIEFDLKIAPANPSDTLLVEYPAILLSGPGGSASIFAPAQDIHAAIGQWSRMQLPIREQDWILESGAWQDLMSNVTQVRVTLEYIYGMETVWFDNFCVLGAGATAVEEVAEEDQLLVFPNPSGPARRINIVQRNGQLLENISLYDLGGRRLLSVSRIRQPQYELQCEGLPAGTYVLRIEGESQRVFVRKIVL